MNRDSIKKNNSDQVSLVNLMKQFSNQVNNRAATTSQSQQSVASGKSKTSPNKSQTSTSLLADLSEQMSNDDTNVNYKAKWEESEAKYRELEKKYRQLETGTFKQMQNKISRLELEARQMKIVKDQIAEICACRQLTAFQLEQLRSLVNDNQMPVDIIANKNDFLQQTRKIRDMLKEQNDELLSKIDQLFKNKRKRVQFENDSNDD